MKVNQKTDKTGSEKALWFLLDAVAAPVFIWTHENILYANLAAAKLSGLNPEDLKQQKGGYFIRMDEAARFQLREGGSGEARAYLTRPGGSEIPVWLSYRRFEPELLPASLQEETLPIMIITVKEVSAADEAYRQAEQARQDMQRRTDELAVLIDSLPEAVMIQDYEGRITRVNLAALDMIGFDPTFLKPAELLSRIDLRNLNRERLEEMPHDEAMRGKRVRNIRMILAGRESSRELAVSSSPILERNQVVGSISVWRDISEVVQRRHDLEAMVQVASVLRNLIGMEEMIPHILNQVKDLLKVEGASLLLEDAATGDLFVKMGIGVWNNTTGQRLPMGRGITSQVIAEGKPYLNNDIQSEPALVTNIFSNGLKCGACVGVSSHNIHIGAVWVGSNQPITENALQLLTGIADIAASNLFRARLFEQTQLRLQRLSALHNIDMAITSSLDLDLTLGVFLDQVVSQMQVDAADILLFDPALHWLEFASGRGFVHPEARYEPQRLGDTPAGQVVMERKMIAYPSLNKVDTNQRNWISTEEGFQAYFAAPLIAKGQVKGVLELFHRAERYPDNEWLEFLETLSTQAAIAIDGAELFERLQRSNEELSLAYDATIEGWSRALELRDQETHGHAQRVTEMTIYLARRMGVSDEEMAHYRRGVLLHDIGKMAIPDSILLKDGPLTPEEQEIMRRHPVYAYDLLHPISYLRLALDIPYAHHEWWDGSGYPRGLKREEIPLSARIFAVVDVWDALRSDRSYRPAWPVHKVLEHIRSLSGTHFDPQVVDAFVKMLESRDTARRPKLVFP